MNRTLPLLVLAVACVGVIAVACARTNRAKIRIAWTTESSQDLYGFVIYRGQSAKGPWERVNPLPILAIGGPTTNIPHDYEYVDTDESLVLDHEYWYWLVTVDNDGTTRPAIAAPAKVMAKVRIDRDFPPLKRE